MALPTPAKTWQHSVNLVASAGATVLASMQNSLFLLKNTLKGFANNPWTVARCCDSTQVKSDGTDLWAASTNLVWSTGAHSWMVLTCAASGVSFCFDLNTASSTSVTVVVSQAAGFTGGATNARPTATDEYVISTGVFIFGASSAFQTVWHVMHSTDGLVTQMFCYYNSIARVWLGVERLSSTSLSSPIAIAAFVNMTSGLTHAQLVAANGGRFFFRNGSSTYVAYPSEETNQSYWLGTIPVANEISSEYHIGSIGLTNNFDVGSRGRHGTLTDIWWGQAVITDGGMYPGDGTRTFAQIGTLVIPWNGTAMTIA
jgi:hypothetical protein